MHPMYAESCLQVPPSGPMDALSLQYANALCGNDDRAAALEVTLRGPRLKFHRAATVAVCGGESPVSVTSGGSAVARPMWENFQVAAGDIVSVGAVAQGVRCYIAVDGGFDAPLYLGSRSTFPSGNLGGYQGRPLQVRLGTRHLQAATVPRWLCWTSGLHCFWLFWSYKLRTPWLALTGMRLHLSASAV